MRPPRVFLDRDRRIELGGTAIQPVGDAAGVPMITDRLELHKLALERAGVTDLSTLGPMSLSGPVVPQVGVAVPEQDQYEAQTVPFQHAYKFDSVQNTLIRMGGIARQLKARQLVVSGPDGPILDDFRPDMRWGRELRAIRSLPTIYVDAYIAATRLEIEDDTQIVLKYPNRFLFLIANEIQVGKNVTITWDRSLNNAPDPPNTREKRPTAAANGLWGVAGETGIDGAKGYEDDPARTTKAYLDGADGPEVELWTVSLQGKPIIDVQGQDGARGGGGGQGGDGGDGSPGVPAVPDPVVWWECKSSNGAGGNGGDGGRGGDGGTGGDGGHGGRCRIYALQAVVTTLAQGFLVSAVGGRKGRGGPGGAPGRRGAGGKRGDNPRNCRPNRDDGEDGNDGAPGQEGKEGRYDGEAYNDAIQLNAITEADVPLTLPALERVEPQIGFEGDLITVHGFRFTQEDELLIDHQVTAISVIDNQRFSFVVPAVAGGNKTIQLRRRDGKLSNKNSFAVQPRISTLLPGTRVHPGRLVTLRGSGFSPEASVIAERERVVGVQFVDTNTLRFTIRRPANIHPNAAGEPMVLQVLVAQVPPSNTLEIALDTFRMMVFGDSILWGQGLVESQKIHNHVKSFMRQQDGDIETYCDLRAHSGAIIGIDDPTVAAALDGEIPTDYPTITQQAEATDIGAPETVDLVLVNGGINDINFRRILDPSVGEDTLRDLIDRHCRQDMERLLVRIADRFNKATIIVTGYYPIFSEESNLLSMAAFLSLLGVALAQIGGGLVGGVISIAMKDQVVRRAALFAAESEKCIQRAVDAANLQSSKRRVLFAQPEISRTHATLASDPWIFGVGAAGAPEDSAVAPGRAILCESAPAGRCDVTTCRVASMGHPNARGAQAYAEEITALLHTQTFFPEEFLWGVATAGYQVEGGPTTNDWDIFTQSEAIRDRVHRLTQFVGQDVELAPVGDAVQHHQIEVIKQDLDRAQLLGLNAYRFSIEWSRVEPNRGQVNEDELTYYDRVFDELRQRGLEPIVTLNHITLPQWVLTPSEAKDPVSGLAVPDQPFKDKLGGWENVDVVECFAKYVRAVVERYKGKVKTWITLNEPVGSMVGLGYLAGIWPPGFSLDGKRARQAYFNLLKAHVRAYDVIKAIYGPDGQSRVGIAHAMLYGRLTSAGGGLGDIHVAATNQFNYFYNEHLLNSLMNERVDVSLDRHPADRDYKASTELYGLTSWEKKLDFLGLNYYRSVYVGHDPILSIVASFAGGFFDNDLRDSDDQHQLLNDMGWEIYPKGIYHILKYVHENYDLPVLIAENGISQAVDCHRAPFTVSHLQQVLRAIQEGVKVQGYIHWTLVDNYEWQDHYRSRSRFGLFTVDRTGETQPFRRCITEGALALQYIIADNAVEQAAEKFGSMAANASSVSPPVQNAGALWVSDGTTAENPTILKLNLYLSKLSPTEYLGMIFLHESHKWYRLETIQWDGRTLSFEFTDTDHALIQGTATSTDNTLRGELGYSPPRSWQAKRETLSGTWRSERSPHYLHFHGLEHPSAGGWSGKYHTLGSHRSHRRWASGYLTQTDDRVNFAMDDEGIFNGSLPQASDSMLAGEIRLVGGGGGATKAWRAQRLPDYIA